MREVVLPSHSRISRVVALLLTAVLLVLTVRTGLGFMFARAAPPVAYRIDWNNPEVLAAQADYLVRTATTKAATRDIADLAMRAVAGGPLSPFAVRNYGFAVLAQGKAAQAKPVLAVAGRVSLRDFLAHAWLLEDRRRAKDAAGAVYHADIMMRQRTSSYEQVLPIMVGLLADQKTIAPMAAALKRDPVWRLPFLNEMGGDGENLLNKLDLLNALKRQGSPASDAEMAPVFRQAWSKINPRTLRARWDQLVTLPDGARAGLLIDGDFEHPNVPPPFSWSYYPNREVYAEVSRRSGAGRALFASFDGTRSVSFAGQQLLLSPGRYRLTGAVLAEDKVEAGQFRWTLSCGRNGGVRDTVATAPLRPRLGEWSRFAATFTVPKDCTEQQLWLSAIPADPADVASLWVDNLSLQAF